MHVWSGDAGEVATGVVRDLDGSVTEAWTGPQVAWKMARGRPGAFGGKMLTSWPVWLGLSAVFLLGLVDLRRPLSLRNLDLLVLLSFGVSLAFFNRGEVLQSAALAVPPLVYLLARTAGSASARRPVPARRTRAGPCGCSRRRRSSCVGFRIGLNVDQGRTVIDVGYAGVIGADRILDGRAPYGAMPVTDDPHAVRARRTPTGRSASGSRRTAAASRRTRAATRTGPSPISPTSPPCSLFGWSGKWDDLPAAHATSIAFDLLVLVGLALVGRRFGGARLAAALAFAWAAFPFTTYALMSNTNDAIMPAAARLGLLARVVTGGARRRHRARRLDEVRGAARRAALAHVPLGPPAGAARALRRRLRGRDAARLLDPAARAVADRRPAHVLGPDARVPARTASRRSRSGAGASTTRAGSPTSRRSRRSSRCA